MFEESFIKRLKGRLHCVVIEEPAGNSVQEESEVDYSLFRKEAKPVAQNLLVKIVEILEIGRPKQTAGRQQSKYLFLIVWVLEQAHAVFEHPHSLGLHLLSQDPLSQQQADCLKQLSALSFEAVLPVKCENAVYEEETQFLQLFQFFLCSLLLQESI